MLNKNDIPSSFTFVRSFQGITEYRLDNGLKVLLFKEPSQGSVTVNITYLVGSRHEGRGEAGMAHLLEHMLFKGTKKTRDVKGALDNRGASFNATTWYDRTNYFETLTPTYENLEFALALEADRMLHSTILQEDLDAEMTVVRNEFEMGENNPVHVLHDQMMSAAYLWHNYGKTTIGNRSDIERVPVTSLRKFYEHYYQPDNAVLLVAGQFEEQGAFELIHKHFAPLKKPVRKLEETYTEEPPQDGPRQVLLEREGDMASVAAAYHIPQTSHEDHAAVKLAVDILAEEPNGLIYKELVASKECSELFGSAYSLHDPSMALFFVRPTKVEEIDTVKAKFLELIEKVGSTKITQEDLDRAKAKFKRQFKNAMSQSKKLAIGLSESIASGDWRLFFWHAKQVEKVSIEDILRVVEKYFISSNRTLGVFMPTKNPQRAKIPSHKLDGKILENLQENPDFCAGESFEPSIENIESKVLRTKKGAVNTTILPKQSRNNHIKAKVVFRFGSEKSLLPHKEALLLLPDLMYRGSKSYSYQGLKDKLDSLSSSLQLFGGSGRIGAYIESDKTNFLPTLKVLGQTLKESLLLADELALIKAREVDDYEEIKQDPQRVCLNELEKLKYPCSPDSFFYPMSIEEKIDAIKKVSRADLVKAYDQFLKWGKLDFSLTGPVNLTGHELMDELAVGYCQDGYERIVRPFMENCPEKIVMDTKDKEMAFLAMAFNFPMQDTHEDYPYLVLANFIFGENMNSRLMKRLREKEGISYGTGSYIDSSKFIANSSLNMYAMAALENVTRAEKAMSEEWVRFLKDGISEKELSDAKTSLHLNFQNSLASDKYLVDCFLSDMETKRTFAFRQELFEKISQATVLKINQAIQRYWNQAQLSVVIAGDKAKMK